MNLQIFWYHIWNHMKTTNKSRIQKPTQAIFLCKCEIASFIKQDSSVPYRFGLKIDIIRMKDIAHVMIWFIL